MTKAVILAAGKGTRMGDLTQEIPKPMLEVQGRPILEHIVEGLKEVGIRQFHLITGWRAEVIESHFGDGSRFGVEMSYSRQVVQDGTGKAPELAKEFVGQDDFVLTYGDILVKPETYRHMIERWKAGQFDGVLTVTAAEDVTKGGLFFFDDAQFCLTRLVEKPNAPRSIASVTIATICANSSADAVSAKDRSPMTAYRTAQWPTSPATLIPGFIRSSASR